MRYRALVFDFFGVVCNEIGSLWFLEHQLGDEAFEEKIERPADLGIESQEEHFKELSKLSGIPAADIEREWEGRARFNTELVALIREWHKEFKVGLLSNAPSPFFRTLLARSGFESVFDAIVVSSEVGYAKPDPHIYLSVLEKLGVAPTEALMIDDRQENIDGAARLGMPGHLYISTEALRRELGSA